MLAGISLRRVQTGCSFLDQEGRKIPLVRFEALEPDQVVGRYNPLNVCFFSRLFFHPESLRTEFEATSRSFLGYLAQVGTSQSLVRHHLTCARETGSTEQLQLWLLYFYLHYPPFRQITEPGVNEAVAHLAIPFLTFRFVQFLARPPILGRCQQLLTTWLGATLEPMASEAYEVMIAKTHPNLASEMVYRQITNLGQYRGMVASFHQSHEQWASFTLPSGLTAGDLIAQITRDFEARRQEEVDLSPETCTLFQTIMTEKLFLITPS
jgi:hypothetical protein